MSATFLSLVLIWFLLDPPPDSGATIALAVGATLMWLPALLVAATRRAYRRRS